MGEEAHRNKRDGVWGSTAIDTIFGTSGACVVATSEKPEDTPGHPRASEDGQTKQTDGQAGRQTDKQTDRVSRRNVAGCARWKNLVPVLHRVDPSHGVAIYWAHLFGQPTKQLSRADGVELLVLASKTPKPEV